VTVQHGFSIEPVDVTSTQITKSVNLKTNEKDPSAKSADTMGMKHRVDSGIYVTFGSINRQLAKKTGFSDEDAAKLKAVMQNLFENDESSARPAGSMEVLKLIWWTQDDSDSHKILSPAKIHRSLVVSPDGSYILDSLEGVQVEEIDGQ
jgi:CRISPR-associated protein Csd2